MNRSDSSPRRWDDNRLRAYLESKGVIKTKQQATRDELLTKMRETYASAANPLWQAWSDSYIVSPPVTPRDILDVDFWY